MPRGDIEKSYKKLGSRLREGRLARGLSQIDMATSMGVTFQQVQKYEKGENRIPIVQLVRAARRMDVSVNELLDCIE